VNRSNGIGTRDGQTYAEILTRRAISKTKKKEEIRSSRSRRVLRSNGRIKSVGYDYDVDRHGPRRVRTPLFSNFLLYVENDAQTARTRYSLPYRPVETSSAPPTLPKVSENDFERVKREIKRPN